MLQTPGIYIIKDGTGLESKCRWKGASQFAAISNLHNIVDSIKQTQQKRSLLSCIRVRRLVISCFFLNKAT